MYYNCHDLLTYNRLYNMVMGVRGHGKTYCYSNKCIALGLEQKKISFVILVRYKEDMLAIKDSWWSVVEHLYPDYIFYTKRNIIYAQNSLESFPIGEFVILRQYQRVKRTPRPNVRIIFFDEFLNEENDYLPNEITAFTSICDSIIRNRDNVRVFLVSNHISVLNPYFNYFGITQLGKRFTRGLHDSILEFTDSAEFIEFRKNTKFGKSIEGTEYGEYAMMGKFLLDDMTNVSKVPDSTCHHEFNLILEGIPMEVCTMENILYIRRSKDKTAIAFTPYVDDAVLGAIFCTKSLNHFDYIVSKFTNDEIMYESLEIKNAIINFVRFKMGTGAFKKG